MNQPTRERLHAALLQLTEGTAGLEALVADQEADLLPSERKALQQAIEPLAATLETLGVIRLRTQERAPARAKVTPPAAPVAPPVADRGVAVGLKALALSIRELSYAVRGHSETVLEARQPPPPAPTPPAAPAPRSASAGVRTGQVAEALGVPVVAVQRQIRSAGGPAVGLQVGDWRICSISHGPSGKASLRWQQIEAQQQAA